MEHPHATCARCRAPLVFRAHGDASPYAGVGVPGPDGSMGFWLCPNEAVCSRR
jgi:hypothetical protein